ncbi:MAG TPA: DUF4058 family protein, partial [Urbifossiella sp.]
ISLEGDAAMPLLDHFHSPLDPRIGWESFHHRWANAIADHLDEFLPATFFARVEVHLGSEVATDVTEEELVPRHEANGAGGVAVETYSPPMATTIIPVIFPDEAAVEVRSADPGARLLAVIELISPANKKSPDARRAFCMKSAAYFQHGIGLIIVDPVTDRRFNLHNEIAQLLAQSEQFAMPGNSFIYASAYRPIPAESQAAIEAWAYELTIGEALPTVPLYLRGHGCIPLDLEATYMETRRRVRF